MMKLLADFEVVKVLTSVTNPAADQITTVTISAPIGKVVVSGGFNMREDVESICMKSCPVVSGVSGTYDLTATQWLFTFKTTSDPSGGANVLSCYAVCARVVE